MRLQILYLLLFGFLGATLSVMSQHVTSQSASAPAHLIVVEPGHFHASLVQREMYLGIAPRVSVYAPLGPELLDYLNRVSLFNRRPDKPTRWDLDVRTSSDPMAQMLHDKPGNAVVFTGKNRLKIDRILASLEAGLHVFADKPWIIRSEDIGKLERALKIAREKRLAAYDIMTERFEITSELQRAFVNTPEVFGKLDRGRANEPAIYAKSVHHVMKTVAGVPLRRPTWFFDIAEYGEGLSDVGTHVVDLVQWTAFPDQPLDYKKDVRMITGKRWPLTLTSAQFQQVTGESTFPASLGSQVHDGKLDYFCNNSVGYTLRDSHVKLEILWNWEAAPGTGDVYEASFRGSKARIEIRQGQPEKFVPEVYIVPVSANLRSEVVAATRRKIEALQTRWPGLSMQEGPGEIRLVIPDKFRVGHEAHFAQVAHKFFNFMSNPSAMPPWESDGMLAKYYVSTKGVEMGLR